MTGASIAETIFTTTKTTAASVVARVSLNQKEQES
jgi:hypothetical protein